MHLLLRFALVVTVFGLIACTSNRSTPTAPSSLPGTSSNALEAAAGITWTLRSFTDSLGQSVSLPGRATFTIAFADGRVNIQSDCNRCTGAATAQEGSVDIGLLACTRAFCSSSPVDSQFEQALQGRHTVALQGSRLTLSSSRAVLDFAR